MAPHTTRAAKGGGRAYYYYHCPKRRQYGVEGCSHGKHHPAEALESEVWQAVSSYIKNPERLRADIERAIELMRQEVPGDASLAAKAWAISLLRSNARGAATSTSLPKDSWTETSCAPNSPPSKRSARR